MKFPLTEPDDVGLFGFLLVLASGAGIVTSAMTGDSWLAFGVMLVVLGLPGALLVFMAAAVEETK